MSPKLQIQLEQDTFYKCDFEEDSNASILKGKLIFSPTTSVKVLYITLCFRGKLFMNKGFQSTRKTLFEHTWTFHRNVGSTIFNAQQYVYDFELPLPANLPESCVADYAKVEYDLKATVETPLFSSNIRADKSVFIHKNNSALLSLAYNTHIENSWNDMIDYEVIVPSHEYVPGDSFPITFKHEVLNSKCKLINVWAGLNEKTIYNKADGSQGDESSCVKKWLHTTFAGIPEDCNNSYLSLTVPKSSKNVHFDSVTPYVEVVHNLSTRIEVEINGKIHQIRSSIPIRVVRQTSSSVFEEDQMYELLPTYEIIRFDCPPTYDTSKSEIVPQTEAPPAYIRHEVSA